MNINDFLGHFKYGARPTLFEVIIPFLGEDFRFYAKGTSLPSATIGQITIQMQGRDIQLPGDRTYDSISFAIIEDSDYKIRKRLIEWMDRIYNTETGTRGSLTEITNDILIHALDENYTPQISFQLFGAFPQSIDAVDLNWDSKDTIVTYNATFIYNYYKMI